MEKARAGIGAADSEVQKTLSWLQYDQLPYWQRQIRKLTVEVNEARTNLYRKQLGPADQQQPHREEKMIYEKAKRQLAEAESKIDKVKYWARIIEREAHLYKGQVQQLGTAIDISIPQAQAKLEKALHSLDAYLALQAPTIDDISGSSGSSTSGQDMDDEDIIGKNAGTAGGDSGSGDQANKPV